MVALIFVLIAFVRAHDRFIATETVINLNSLTIDSFIKSTELVLVNFYAPWCSHCRSLNEDLQLVARSLLQPGRSKIGNVDCTDPSNKDLTLSYEINVYPTIAVFKNGKRIPDYSGGRNASDILDYVRLKLGPDVVPIATMEDLAREVEKIKPEAFFGSGTFAVILALFHAASRESNEGVHGESATHFISSASNFEQAIFLIADSHDLVTHFETAGDSIFVFTKPSVLPTSHFLLPQNATDGALTEEILKHVSPLIVEFSTLTRPFLQLLPIKSHLLVFFDVASNVSSLVTFIDTVLGPLRGRSRGISIRLVCVMVSSDNSQLFQIFEMHSEIPLPQAILLDMSDLGNLKQYRSDDPNLLVISENLTSIGNEDAALMVFARNALEGMVPRYVASLPPDPRNRLQGTVTTLVGSNFNSIIMEEAAGKDSFLYIYAPWCAYCKSIESMIAELAVHYKADNSIEIFRIDGSKNDINHTFVHARGFPSFYFFPAGKKGHPVEFQDKRKTAQFISFIEANRNAGSVQILVGGSKSTEFSFVQTDEVVEEVS